MAVEALPVESGPAKDYPPAVFVARPGPDWFVHKQAVLAATGNPDVMIMNALGSRHHAMSRG